MVADVPMTQSPGIKTIIAGDSTVIMKLLPKNRHLFTFAALALPLAMQGANISMNANDAVGTTSFNAAGHWSNALAPTSANNYFTAAYGMRTPGDANNYTFAGASLTLSPLVAATSAYALIVKSSVASGVSWTMTINNFTNAGALMRSGGSTGANTILAGNVFAITGNSTIAADQTYWTINSPLAGTGIITNTFANNQTITYAGTNTAFLGGLNITAGTVILTSPSGGFANPATLFTNQLTLLSGAVLQDSGGVSFGANSGVMLLGNATVYTPTATTTTVLAGPVSDLGVGYKLTKSGAGALSLAGSNTIAGGITLSAGTLKFSTYGLGTAPLTYTAGSLQWLPGSTADLSALSPTITANAILDVGTNYVGFSNGLTIPGGLTKLGAGTLALSNYCSIGGTTTISNGVLALVSAGSIASSTNINVTSAGTLDVTGLSGGYTMGSPQALSGSGTVKGALTDYYNSAIAPGGSRVAGTLTVNGNLTLGGYGGSDALNLDITNTPGIGGGSNDLVVVNGNLNLNGGTVVNLNFLSGAPGAGIYTILKYTGTLTGDPAAMLTAPSLGTSYNVTFAVSNSSVVMVIAGAPQAQLWTGLNSSEWDFATANWTNRNTLLADDFSQGDSVTFDDSGNSTSPVDLTAALLTTAITVSNNTAPYTFSSASGQGSLTGPALLTKSGTGILILDTTNTYTGGTLIKSGTVQVGNYDAAGASLGSGAVTNNASLVFAHSDTVVMPSVSGNGTLSCISGTTAAPNASTYTGNTYITSAYALLQNSAAFGATNGSLIVNGGQLYVVANVDIGANPLVLSGSGPDGNGAIRKGYAGPSTFFGTVTLVGDTSLSIDGGATLTLTNAAGVIGTNVNLTLAGGGTGNLPAPIQLGTGSITVNGSTWNVGASNNYTGTTMLNGGAYRITAPGSLGLAPASFNSAQIIFNGGALETATNVILNDGLRGLQDYATGTITTDTNTTLTIYNDITGSGTLTKTGPGKLVLAGTNDFTGYLYVDSGQFYVNTLDGLTVIANTAALANLPVSPGSPYIWQRDNTAGSSTLGLDGTAGSVTIAPDLYIRGRNVTVANIENLAGSNTISGNITVDTGGALYIQSDAGILNLTAPFPYAASTPATARSLTFLGAGTTLLSAGIQNINSGGTAVNVTQSGTGTLILGGISTGTGSTTVSGGVLAVAGTLGSGNVTVSGGLLTGTGIIPATVTVSSGGSIEAGSTNIIGTLTVTNLSLAGNTIAKISKTGSVSDLFTGLTNVVYGGTLTVTNLAGTLATGDHFTLFSTAASSGGFTNIVGSPGAGLAYSFTNGVLSVVAGVASNPTNITYSVSGGTLSLSWPADHLGWILQAQTNALTVGLISASNAWYDVTGSAAVTSTSIVIDPAKPTVFYRLRHP